MGGVVRRAVLLLAMGMVTAATVALAPASPVAADSGLTLTASSAKLGADRTTVVLRGSYTCGPFTSGRPDRCMIDLTIRQVRRSGTVTGYGYVEPSICDGSPQSFAATLTSASGARFTTGPATWVGGGYVEGDGILQFGGVDPTPITITR
jgi:hypothetical protein